LFFAECAARNGAAAQLGSILNEMAVCPKRAELTGAADQSLLQVKSLIEAQIRVLRETGSQSKLLELDKELEIAFGNKERCFGALSEHTKEHGC
jgi:hypothetical protein